MSTNSHKRSRKSQKQMETEADLSDAKRIPSRSTVESIGETATGLAAGTATGLAVGTGAALLTFGVGSGLGGAALGTAVATAASAAAPFAAVPIALGVVGAALSGKYKSLPITKKTASVDPVSETWEDRPKANIVKWLMQQSNTSLEAVAEHLGCTVTYLNNKLFRDSFSFEDLILVAYACGYSFALVNNNTELEAQDAYRIDLIEHFRHNAPEVLDRVNAIEERIQQERRAEYEQKKAELERMKAEYGFED